eukprot:g6747.t1
MDTYSCDTHGRGEVGIGAARHVYGPASVHQLPCKIHHTGPAPVATYFRPRPPLAEGGPRSNDNTATTLAGANGDLDGGDAMPQNNDSRGAADSGPSDGGSGGGGAEENATPVVAGGKGEGAGEGGGAANDGQKWELFEDDSAEYTARFRGRKLVGRKVELPTEVHGVVLREQPCPDGVREDNEDVTSYWAAETSFRDVMVWGHDELRRESTVDRSLAWLEVSKSIHDP